MESEKNYKCEYTVSGTQKNDKTTTHIPDDKKEQVYCYAKNKMQSAKTYDAFYEAAYVFHKISNYKDANEQTVICVLIGNKLKTEEIALCQKKTSYYSEEIENRAIGAISRYKDYSKKDKKKENAEKSMTRTLAIFTVVGLILYIIVALALILNNVEAVSYEHLAIGLMIMIIALYVCFNIKNSINKRKADKAYKNIFNHDSSKGKSEDNITIIMAHDYWSKRLKKAQATQPPFEIKESF